jgi:arylsulfatase A-like enzyme
MKRALAVGAVVVALLAALWWYRESRRPRGIVLISIDTLRADHLGAYGYPLDTSPFFDELSARGTLFEHAIVQLPGTLPSHMTMFTGLYPAQHGVYPPDSVLSSEIPTLPELFHAAGFRTAGFTEGGYTAGHFGFSRGFDVFGDQTPSKPGGAEYTFNKAREWVDTLQPGDRFFLFVHTYEVHDPYMPPESYRANAWKGQEPDTWEPNGVNLTAASRGRLPVTREAIEYYAALYDACIREVDDVLRGFLEHLWKIRLSRDTTVVITSDHGEEFFEHGSFVHRQVYDETLHVPLLFRRLGQRHGARVPDLVETVDLAPTLLEVAGIEADPSQFAGDSFASRLGGGGRPAENAEAFAEGLAEPTRVVYRQTDHGLFALLLTRMEADGGWVAAPRSLSFDWSKPQVSFRVQSYGEPRDLSLYVNGFLQRVEPIVPDVPREIVLALPSDEPKNRVRIEVADCAPVGTSPIQGGCVGLLLAGITPERRELYRLDEDPLAQVDLSSLRPALVRDLEVAIEGNQLEIKATAGHQDLTVEQVEQLKALGYLQ